MTPEPQIRLVKTRTLRWKRNEYSWSCRLGEQRIIEVFDEGGFTLWGPTWGARQDGEGTGNDAIAAAKERGWFEEKVT